MRNDPTFNSALARLYRTAVAVSALIILLSVSAVYAADPPVPRSNVSVNVNPTTSYYTATNSTVRLPNGVSASPSTTVAPVVSRYPNGLQQTVPMGVTIDAIKKSAPLPTVVRATKPSLNNAAKRLLGGNLAGLVLGAGLNSLLDGIGALIDEGGQLRMLNPDPTFVPPTSGGYQIGQTIYPTAQDACEASEGCAVFGACIPKKVTDTIGHCIQSNGVGRGSYQVLQPACPSGSVLGDFGCMSGDDVYIPVSSDSISDAVDSFYEPEPSDWTNLTPHLSLDDVEITSSPTLQV
ncbi:MAG TPA: hypothetical protein VL020_03715 [Pseudomonadales bacterium]|nr:hypothetical protein [Pseudomonadales bacterium]